MGRFLSTILLGASGAAVLLASGPLTAAVETRAGAQAAAKTCAGDNGGITLPQGFCATVFADNVGHARHMVVAPTGVVYVNTWSGDYYGHDKLLRAGFSSPSRTQPERWQSQHRRALWRDRPERRSSGGTGIGLYKGSLYAEIQ